MESHRRGLPRSSRRAEPRSGAPTLTAWRPQFLPIAKATMKCSKRRTRKKRNHRLADVVLPSVAIGSAASDNAMVDFLMTKTKLLDRSRGSSMNDRKVTPAYVPGRSGRSPGGLTAGNISTITGDHQRRPHGTWRIWVTKSRWFARVNASPRYHLGVPSPQLSQVTLTERGELAEKRGACS